MTDLAMQAERNGTYTYSRFLTLPEQEIFLSARSEFNQIYSTLWGHNESAIRKIAVFGSEEDFGYPFEPPVKVIHVFPSMKKFAETLSHRDYLGSMMALGIEREMTGDIIIRENEAWVLVMENIAEFMVENLTKIRHTDVMCEIEEGEVPELKPDFITMNFNVASERIDLIVAACAGGGRAEAAKLLKEERIFVNGRTISAPGHKLKEGDELVIRGSGKYIYDGIKGTSRKGRLNITVRKYG